MHQLTLDELDRRWADVERAVDATPGIDPWCSGPDWQIPTNRGFAPGCDPLVLTTDGPGPGYRGEPEQSAAGFALLARYAAGGERIVSGLEPLWGFGCPIAGPDPGAVSAEVADHLAGDPHWTRLILAGLPPLPPDPTDPTQPSTTLDVATPLAALGRVGLAQGITRRVIDLTSGHDAWLAHRSPRFRRNLRRARHAADRAGLQVVDVSTDGDLFDRLLTIELRSWKGQEGSGITGTEMTTMYRLMVERLAARHRVEASVAMLGGDDVGYILGGIRNRRYRGLQLSYVVEAADLSIGNLLQDHQLARLAADDKADVYDLGMDIGYKRRWSDRAEPSAILVIER